MISSDLKDGQIGACLGKGSQVLSSVRHRRRVCKDPRHYLSRPRQQTPRPLQHDRSTLTRKNPRVSAHLLTSMDHKGKMVNPPQISPKTCLRADIADIFMKKFRKIHPSTRPNPFTSESPSSSWLWPTTLCPGKGSPHLHRQTLREVMNKGTHMWVPLPTDTPVNCLLD